MSDDNVARARMWIAQAWCTPATSHKVMDTDLAEACASALAAAVRAKVNQLSEMFPKGNDHWSDYEVVDWLHAHAAGIPPPPVTP